MQAQEEQILVGGKIELGVQCMSLGGWKRALGTHLGAVIWLRGARGRCHQRYNIAVNSLIW